MFKSFSFTGIAAVIGNTTGQFAGGFILNRYKWSVKGVMRFGIITTLIAMLPILIFLLSCPNERESMLNAYTVLILNQVRISEVRMFRSTQDKSIFFL